MNNEERMHKLANGSDTAKWAHKEIIELREQIEAMHNSWSKNQAKDQDLLHECSNENAKLREKLAQAQSELTKFIQNTEKELRKGAEAL